MNLPAIIFAVFAAVLGVLLANSRALLPDYMLAERFARNGILKGQGFPDADAPAAFVARLKARERIAAIASAVAVVPAIAAVVRLPEPTMAFPLMVSVAFTARIVMLAVLGAREALQGDGGRRISRGRVVTLTDLVPAWAVAVLVGVQVLFVAAATLLVSGPAWQPWALGASLVLTAGAVALAAWLARQPQRAEDAVALAWSDAMRREDVVLLLALGPLVAMMVGALLLGFETQGPTGVVVWANFVVVAVAAAVADAASRRRGARLVTREFADADR